MKDMIKDIFKIAGHEIDFSDVDYSFEGLPCKLSSLLRSKSQNQIETTVCDSLRERWNGIESGSKEFVCYEEIDGMLRPCHVGVGQGIPFYPCVFILNCNLLMSQGKEIYLRIKIEKTQSPYIASVYGVTYE